MTDRGDDGSKGGVVTPPACAEGVTASGGGAGSSTASPFDPSSRPRKKLTRPVLLAVVAILWFSGCPTREEYDNEDAARRWAARLPGASRIECVPAVRMRCETPEAKARMQNTCTVFRTGMDPIALRCSERGCHMVAR